MRGRDIKGKEDERNRGILGPCFGIGGIYFGGEMWKGEMERK